MQETPHNQNNTSFYGLGIAPAILDVIQRLGFKVPTPIQQESIPIALKGNDMIGIAQTGTGKTLAFGIPMVQELLKGKGAGLVVLPTRELAEQVDKALRQVGDRLGLRTAVIIGGASMLMQRRALERQPHIVIGTPGRILDHLEHRSLSLAQVSILVLDEADRMLDMGFAPQLNRILEAVPKDRQTMLFSATMPDQIVKIAQRFMRTPLRIEVARTGATPKEVSQEVFFVLQTLKPRLLEKILKEIYGPVLIFTRTKYGAKKLHRLVSTMGLSSSEIHSNRSLAQRREALEGFKNRKVPGARCDRHRGARHRRPGH